MATLKFTCKQNKQRVLAARQRLHLNYGRARSTHEGGVCQDDLRLVGQDVELDDVAVAVPVDDLRVCVGKRSREVRTEEQKQTSVNQNLKEESEAR